MKALMYTAVRTLEVQDVPEPTSGPGQVKVRVSATGICGSDMHGFMGHQARRQPGLILGHETLGTVVEGDAGLVGKRVSVNPLISCGYCEACRAGRHSCCATWQLLGLDKTHGGFAEYVVVPTRNVHPIPDHVTDAAAVMVEPLANAFHILSMIPTTAGLLPQTVILGAGTLGSAILSVAKARGLRVLAVSEPNPERAEVARALGAERVLDPKAVDIVSEIKALTNGLGVPVVVDAVGNSATRQAGAQAVTRGGTVLLLGMDEGPTSFDFQDLVRREVRLQCSFAYTETDFAAALDFVIGGKVDFSPYTDVLKLEEGQSAFERLISAPGDRLKIALVP
jgi:2-desacetyl-2-hydroxyethyl bacteriochlorophyllide A dehydrogenase